MESLRRILPYTGAAVGLAAIYSGVTMYSRYSDARDAVRQEREQKAETDSAVNERVTRMYGGDRLTILTFAASAGVVAPGGKVELCYGVNNATSVKIEPDAPPIKPAVTHCLEVVPKRTTAYTLTATDDRGNREVRTLTIRVAEGEAP